MTGVAVPAEDIARVADAHGRFLAAVSELTDDDVRRPSLLPDWSLGHLLTHVARNADSHLRRTDAALRGEVVDQYPGGFEARAAEIEAGAGRPALELLADVASTCTAVDEAWRDVPAPAWDAVSRDVSGRERALSELPSRRWQEVEVHLVDLDIGITHRDWSDDFVEDWLPRLRRFAGSTEPFDDPRDELAWLFGRLKRDDLPTPPPWG